MNHGKFMVNNDNIIIESPKLEWENGRENIPTSGVQLHNRKGMDYG